MAVETPQNDREQSITISSYWTDWGTLHVRIPAKFGIVEYMFTAVDPADFDRPVASHDHIYGADDFGRAVVYSDGYRYMVTEGDLTNVPDAVIDHVENELDCTVIRGIDTGWEAWGGRPDSAESETYIDVSAADAYSAGD